MAKTKTLNVVKGPGVNRADLAKRKRNMKSLFTTDKIPKKDWDKYYRDLNGLHLKEVPIEEEQEG